MVVVGTGHSGTRWVADRLTAEGLPCTHEQVFTPWRPTSWPDLPRHAAESSWCALAHMPAPDDVLVVAVLRDRTACIESLVRGQVATDPTAHRDLAASIAPGVLDSNPYRAATAWYDELSALAIESAHVVLRLDEMTDDSFALLAAEVML